VAAPKRATARVAALPPRRGSPALGRLAPSGRSLAVGIAIALLAVGAFAVARETSVFAVRKLEIVGGTPRMKAEVRASLAPELGESLLKVNGTEIDGRVASVPDVRSVRFDRSFPHTLRIVVRPERAVLLLRRGGDSWSVSARGRVLRVIRTPGRSSLPRTWVPLHTQVSVGDRLPAAAGGLAAAALAPVRAGMLSQVRVVRTDGREVAFVLRSGLEVRLGSKDDLRLKLAIARRILATLGTSTGIGYLDVSVPERPVAGSGNSQVAGTG
jgi:cell division protein FtsQ